MTTMELAYQCRTARGLELHCRAQLGSFLLQDLAGFCVPLQEMPRRAEFVFECGLGFW